jgi:hypothetical protein
MYILAGEALMVRPSSNSYASSVFARRKQNTGAVQLAADNAIEQGREFLPKSACSILLF